MIGFYLISLLMIFFSLLVVLFRNPIYSLFSLIATFLMLSILYLMLNAEFLSMVIFILYIGAIAVLFLFVIMMLNTEIQQERGDNIGNLFIDIYHGSISFITFIVFFILFFLAYMGIGLVFGFISIIFFKTILSLALQNFMEPISSINISKTTITIIAGISILSSYYLTKYIYQINLLRIFLNKKIIMGVLLSILIFQFYNFVRSHIYSIFSNMKISIDINHNTNQLGQVLYTDYFLAFQILGIILFVAMIGAILLTPRTRSFYKKQKVSDQIKRNKTNSIKLHERSWSKEENLP